MNRGGSRWELPLTFLLALVLIGGGIWANLRLAEIMSGGEEFLVNWYSLRSWFTQGTSPYNPAVRLETEMLAYGHSAQGSEPRLVFASPIYVALFSFPFVLIPDFSLARAFWMMALELAILVTVILGARLVSWRPHRLSWMLLILFAWLGFYSFHSIMSGSPAAIAGLLLVSALTAMRAARWELAGLFFALATSFSQPISLFILFILIWAFASRKRILAVWLVATVAFLSIVGIFFIRDWPLQYVRTLFLFTHQQGLSTPGTILTTRLPGIGLQVGWGITVLIGLVVLAEWFLVRGQDFRWFCWTAYLTLVLETWIGIPTRLSSMVLLLPALVLVLANWEQRIGRLGSWLSVGSLLLLVGGLWLMARNPGGGFGQIGSPSLDNWGMLFPFPAFLLIGMYWVRWWAIRPKRLFADDLRSAVNY